MMYILSTADVCYHEYHCLLFGVDSVCGRPESLPHYRLTILFRHNDVPTLYSENIE